MLCLIIMFGRYLTNSTLVQYNGGTIIKQLKVINTGSNTMNLVLHIPQECNQTNFIYRAITLITKNIQVDLMHAENY